MSEHWTVADVMTTEVLTVDAETPFKDIARQLTEWKVSAAPVIDQDRHVLGVVSQTDLIRKEEFQVSWNSRRLGRRHNRSIRIKALGTTARELMTAPAVTIGQGALLPAAARRMGEHRVTRLVVVDPRDRLIGIVSRTDLLSVFLVPDDELEAQILRRVARYGLWEDPLAIRIAVHGGVVTLTGQLETRTATTMAERLIRTVDGVVGVENQLQYMIDDTTWSFSEQILP
jgi:CBS domain-containing protein